MFHVTQHYTTTVYKWFSPRPRRSVWHALQGTHNVLQLIYDISDLWSQPTKVQGQSHLRREGRGRPWFRRDLGTVRVYHCTAASINYKHPTTSNLISFLSGVLGGSPNLLYEPSYVQEKGDFDLAGSRNPWTDFNKALHGWLPGCPKMAQFFVRLNFIKH